MPRQFPLRGIRRGDVGPTQSCAVLTCGDCGFEDFIVNATQQRALPPAIVERKAAQAGWLIGRREADDRCPACRQKAKPKPPAPTARILPVISPAAPALPEAVVSKTVPLPPLPSPVAVVSADLKRRINQKLFEVYEDEAAGYAKGWSDQRVSEELHAPRALVAEIREEFFGSVKSDADCRAMLDEVNVLVGEVAAIEKRQAELAADVKRTVDKIETLRRAADAVRKVVGA